jgi:hypothetical protein
MVHDRTRIFGCKVTGKVAVPRMRDRVGIGAIFHPRHHR